MSDPQSNGETAMNVNMTFDDITLIHEALVEWASRPLGIEDAKARIRDFAAFVVRHPELVTAVTIMQGGLK